MLLSWSIRIVASGRATTTGGSAFQSIVFQRRPRLLIHVMRATEDGAVSLETTTKSTKAELAAEKTMRNPWLPPETNERGKQPNRFRQHVNPLSRRFQMQAILSKEWPADVFTDVSRPLHVDIGSAKGKFLLQMAASKPNERNYLGLEIRPTVVQLSQERAIKQQQESNNKCLSFLGCNANVDLDRLLKRYQKVGGGPLEVVSIQFPDPHFKSHHQKRRVVTPHLVHTLATFMPPHSMVFLQSDVRDVLDDMRKRFRSAGPYFRDEIQDSREYMQENPMCIPTERETSVLGQNLPVYRTVLRRTDAPVEKEP